jgi:anti-sigma B factor antagonist
LIVHGELDIATAPALARLIGRMRRLGHAVVLDLAEVTFIDSTGLSALMDAYFEARSGGPEFSIRQPSAAVRRVVALAGVAQVLGGAGSDPAWS